MKNYAILAALVLFCFNSHQAKALSIDWSGKYRFEYTEISNTSLSDPKLRKSYILNHLELSPKIIAADGVNIVARFDVLPNSDYPESHVGQQFGKPPAQATGGSSTGADSSVMSGTQGSSTLQVSQLYLTMNQEYGALVVGRAPVQFGLGITHNAGLGDFDHWYDVHDMVGYKFLIGNLSIMPIISRVYDESAAAGQTISDLIWDVEYNNPETESTFGLFHQTRTSSLGSNDAPVAGLGGTQKTGAWKTQSVNVLLGRGFDSFKFKVEAGFLSGNTGISKGTEEVKLSGYGIAAEMEFPRPNSKLQWSLRTGIASGDDPATTGYEGFHFDRNYDVAFLLFNHPIGKYDVFRNALERSPDRRTCTTAPCSTFGTGEALDEESISNAVYLSPKLVYAMSDKWAWNNSVTWAQLQVNPIAGVDVSKNVGFEWDTGFVFKPTERVQWVNELGFLFPGAAFAGGTNGYDTKFTFGFSSKAAISF